MAEPFFMVTMVVDNQCAFAVDEEWIKETIDWSVIFGELASRW